MKDNILTGLFRIYSIWDMSNRQKILGATRNCGRWSEIEAVKLPEIIFGAAILEKLVMMSHRVP